MKKKKLLIIVSLILSISVLPIPSSAYTNLFVGSDSMSLPFGYWESSKTFYVSSGEVRACVAYVDSATRTYAIEAYTEEGFLTGSTKYGPFDQVGNNKCVTFRVTADSDGVPGKEELFFRLKGSNGSDSYVSLDVYED